jgi:protein gp37
MNESAIAWTSVTWNPVSGCSKVSDGCKNCYAMNLSLKRGWTKKPWTIPNEVENVVLKPHKLREPRNLKKPSKVFVNSMSDLFHRVIPDEYLADIFAVMLDLPQHTFQILTKRPENAITWGERWNAIRLYRATNAPDAKTRARWSTLPADPWQSHIWMGASVEDSCVKSRINALRSIPAKVRFISAEPLIGAWAADTDLTGIHWVIVGGESGQGYRAMDMAWARQIRDLCLQHDTAFFFKQDHGYRTELRPFLVEEDGTHWRWYQYPDDKAAPVMLDERGTSIPNHPPNAAWHAAQSRAALAALVRSVTEPQLCLPSGL